MPVFPTPIQKPEVYLRLLPMSPTWFFNCKNHVSQYLPFVYWFDQSLHHATILSTIQLTFSYWLCRHRFSELRNLKMSTLVFASFFVVCLLETGYHYVAKVLLRLIGSLTLPLTADYRTETISTCYPAWLLCGFEPWYGSIPKTPLSYLTLGPSKYLHTPWMPSPLKLGSRVLQWIAVSAVCQLQLPALPAGSVCLGYTSPYPVDTAPTVSHLLLHFSLT